MKRIRAPWTDRTVATAHQRARHGTLVARREFPRCEKTLTKGALRLLEGGAGQLMRLRYHRVLDAPRTGLSPTFHSMTLFQQFVQANWMLILIFVMSGAMLIWPLIQRQMSNMTDIGTHEATRLINSQKAAIVDVRETREFVEGKIPGAIHVPLSQLKDRLEELTKFKERPVIAYCARGQRSRGAGMVLHRAGFTQLYNLIGGHKAWKDAGLPVEPN
jgi:rhodanese-related sulfurtransferase